MILAASVDMVGMAAASCVAGLCVILTVCAVVYLLCFSEKKRPYSSFFPYSNTGSGMRSGTTAPWNYPMSIGHRWATIGPMHRDPVHIVSPNYAQRDALTPNPAILKLKDPECMQPPPRPSRRNYNDVAVVSLGDGNGVNAYDGHHMPLVDFSNVDQCNETFYTHQDDNLQRQVLYKYQSNLANERISAHGDVYSVVQNAGNSDVTGQSEDTQNTFYGAANRENPLADDDIQLDFTVQSATLPEGALRRGRLPPLIQPLQPPVPPPVPPELPS